MLKTTLIAVLAAVSTATCALAGQGWYLLSPPPGMLPTETTPGRIDTSKPLSEWIQSAAFDSARECEQERRKTAEEALQKMYQMPQPKDMLQKFLVLGYVARQSQVCISTDDPRLK